jgi:hypothetical protein
METGIAQQIVTAGTYFDICTLLVFCRQSIEFSGDR